MTRKIAFYLSIATLFFNLESLSVNAQVEGALGFNELSANFISLPSKERIASIREELKAADFFMWHPAHQEVGVAEDSDYRDILHHLKTENHEILNRAGTELKILTSDFVQWINRLDTALGYLSRDGTPCLFYKGKVNRFKALKGKRFIQADLPPGHLKYPSQSSPRRFHIPSTQSFYFVIPAEPAAFMKDLHEKLSWPADQFTHFFSIPSELVRHAGERLPIFTVPVSNSVLEKKAQLSPTAEAGLNIRSISFRSTLEAQVRGLGPEEVGLFFPLRKSPGKDRDPPIQMSIQELHEAHLGLDTLLHEAIYRADTRDDNRLLDWEDRLPEDVQKLTEQNLRHLVEKLSVFSAIYEDAIRTRFFVPAERAAEYQLGRNTEIDKLARTLVRNFRKIQNAKAQAAADAIEHDQKIQDSKEAVIRDRKLYRQKVKKLLSQVELVAAHQSPQWSKRLGKKLSRTFSIENIMIYAPLAVIIPTASFVLARQGWRAAKFFAVTTGIVASGIVALISYNDAANAILSEAQRRGFKVSDEEEIEPDARKPKASIEKKQNSLLNYAFKFVFKSNWAVEIFRRAQPGIQNHKVFSQQIPLPRDFSTTALLAVGSSVWVGHLLGTPVRAAAIPVTRSIPFQWKVWMLKKLGRTHHKTAEEFFYGSVYPLLMKVTHAHPAQIFLSLLRPRFTAVRLQGGKGIRSEGGGQWFFEIPVEWLFNRLRSESQRSEIKTQRQKEIQISRAVLPALGSALHQIHLNKGKELGMTPTEISSIVAQYGRLSKNLKRHAINISPEKKQELIEFIDLSLRIRAQKYTEERLRVLAKQLPSEVELEIQIEILRNSAETILTEEINHELNKRKRLGPKKAFLEKQKDRLARRYFDWNKNAHRVGDDLKHLLSDRDISGRVKMGRLHLADEAFRKPYGLGLVITRAWAPGNDFTTGMLPVAQEFAVNSASHHMVNTLANGNNMRNLYEARSEAITNDEMFRDLPKALRQIRYDRWILQSGTWLGIKRPYAFWMALWTGMTVLGIDLVQASLSTENVRRLVNAAQDPSATFDFWDKAESAALLRAANTTGAAIANYSLAFAFTPTYKLYQAVRLSLGRDDNHTVYVKDANGKIKLGEDGNPLIDEAATIRRMKKDKATWAIYNTITYFAYAAGNIAIIEGVTSSLLPTEVRADLNSIIGLEARTSDNCETQLSQLKIQN